MKRRTWLAALVALCLLALPAALATEADAGEIVADFFGEPATEIYEDIDAEPVDEIDAEPVDEIGAEAVEQDIDAVTMDLDGDDAQSALLAEYSAVEADAAPEQQAVSDGNVTDAGEVPTPDDAPAGDETDATEAPAPDDAPAGDESDAGEVAATDDAPDGDETDATEAPAPDDAPAGDESDAGEVTATDDAPAGDESDVAEAPTTDDAPAGDETDAGEVPAADDGTAAEEPAAPADPIIASFEPITEQVSTAAMLGSTVVTITDDSVTGDFSDVTYKGSPYEPTVTVKVGDKTLIKGTDYNVTYDKNTNAGTATVTVEGIGYYQGTVTKTFKINKASRTVTASYVGDVPDKVYDKMPDLPKDFTLSSKNFVISNVDSGDKVYLNSDAVYSSGANVGAHKLSITLAIAYSSTNYVYKLASSTITSDKSGNITPKQLTIKPGVETNGTLVPQTKVYGTADPSSYKAKVAGVMGETSKGAKDGDKLSEAISGKLAREKGEKVGKYKITIGTIKTKGNYATDPKLEEGYFEITPKSIAQDQNDIGIGSIPNQTYTGSAITPDKDIKLRYGTKTLVKGTDYDLKYSDNVKVGTATVTITGKGNYTGTRTATFRIEEAKNSNKNNNSSNSSSGSSDPSNVLEQFPIVTNGKYVVSTGSTFRLNLGNLSARSFKSSNKKVASVDRNGLVTTKKAGKAKITISLGKKTKIKLNLTVIDPTIPTSVALAPVNTAVKKGDVVTLTPSVPENANPGGYKWKSSNKKVATVKNGVVTFKKPGKVTITCTAKRGKKKARVKFSVSK